MALITRTAKGGKLTIAEMDGNLEYLENTGINNGVSLENLETVVLNNGVALENLETVVLNSGGLSGTNYVYVAADGTAVENATALQVAYDLAKTMLPSSTNRITVIAAPGNYSFSSDDFVMNTQYIDLVSLDGNRSIIFNGSRTITITADYVFVKGIDVLTKPFNIGSNLGSLIVENCKGGNYSFGADLNSGAGSIITSGTFIKCDAGRESFGFFGNPSGKFIDCNSGDYSFGYNSLTNGTFTNCTAGRNSFGSYGLTSGIFINCIANGSFSFGGGNIASGSFTNCIAGDQSLAGDQSFGDTASGVFDKCKSNGNYSFGNILASGTFTNCIGANNAFGGYGAASGIFTNCTGGISSFGERGGSSGVFTNCKAGNYSFGGSSGTYTYCVAGIDSFGFTASGTYTNCIAGNNSFGGSGGLTGKLYYCKLTAGSFRTVSGAGQTRLCLNGTNVENNQG